MDPTLYFSFFFGGLLLCVIAALMYRPPSRACPSCGAQTPTQSQRCRYCRYAFG